MDPFTLSLLAGGGAAAGGGIASALTRKVGGGTAALLPQFAGMLANQEANRGNMAEWDNLRNKHIPQFDKFDTDKLYDAFPELKKLEAAKAMESEFDTDNMGEGFDARMRALNQLEGVADTGQTARAAADRASFERESGMRDKAAREAILSREQEMAGGNNTGRRLADQLQVAQSGADRRAMGDLNTQAQLEGSRMAALQGLGQMGSSLTADQQRAQAARDAIAQFNTQRQDKRDFQNNNLSNQQILGEDQRQMQNLDLRNNQIAQNNNQQQQQFQNQAGITSGMTNQQANFGNAMQQGGQFAASQQQQANQFGQQMTMDRAQMMMGAAAGGASAAMSDKNAKKNISDGEFDVQDFLDKITGYKYEYKDPFKHGMGEQVGVMAQDLKSSKAGQSMVVETEDGLGIDPAAAVSPILASLAQINDRLKKVGA